MTLTALSVLLSIFAFSQDKGSDKSAIIQNGRITVDASHILNQITPTLYGSCIEDVNHEIYGGLYDQRLYGESFEEPPRKAFNKVPGKSPERSPVGAEYAISGMWDAVQKGAAGSSFRLDSTSAFNGKQAQVIVHSQTAGIIGVANKGLNRWGISVRKAELFSGRLYLRSEDLRGPVMVALESADGSKTYAAKKIDGITGEWKKYVFQLTSNSTDPRSRFVIYIETPGQLWLDQAVLLSTGPDEFKGLPIRADIAVQMQREGLNFVRYGGSMVNAPGYRWKKMIGDPDRRPPYNGTWYPYSSNGFGIEDFLKFSEAAGFEAAFAINIEETPLDAADMAEYLKGAVTTPWGKIRADNGHPAPYKIKYIEIGNEEAIDSDSEEEYNHYIDRFHLLYDAIHGKDTGIQLICAAWWRPGSTNVEQVFKALDGKAAYWDLHTDADDANSGSIVDSTLTVMQALFLKWDPGTKMKCAIFEENGDHHDLRRALGHATTLNAVRRHGDFLLTSCAANGLQALGQNDNGWNQGQVFFTPDRVWGMPPFYAQQMASSNHLPLRVMETVEGDLDVTATRSENGNILILHVVNIKANSQKASLELKGFDVGHSQVRSWTLSGGLSVENTLKNPRGITPQKALVLPPASGRYAYTFPPHSYTILKFSVGNE